MDSLIGYTYRDWMRLLKENRFSISRQYMKRASAITLMSISNSSDRRKEIKTYGTQIMQTEVRAPIFILGHWRSGTTLLHTLLSKDNRFAYPNLFQTTHPHTFLVREDKVRRAMVSNGEEKRHMDNVRITFESPGEDESATAAMSLRSPAIGWVFPKNVEFYDQFLTFENSSEINKGSWLNAMDEFSKKLTYRYKKPLLFKSPTHTARIGILLEKYPDARFINIHRNPYKVFLSTKNMFKKVLPSSSLQNACFQTTDEYVLERYKVMYDAYFKDLGKIPDGQFVNVRFEDLEVDMLGQVRRIYEELEIPGFNEFKPALEKYINSIANYKKNPYPEIPAEQCARVYGAWERNFLAWNYPG